MNKNFKKLFYGMSVAAIAFVSMANVNALTIKETVNSDSQLDKIQDNTVVIGITKFEPNITISALRAAKAAQNDALFNKDLEGYKGISIYYLLEGDWYSVDEENQVDPLDKDVPAEKEIIEALNEPKIYYVNNEEKKLEVPLNINLNEGEELVFYSNNSGKDLEIKYEDGKLLVPATLDVVNVKIKNTITEEEKTVDNVEITEDGDFVPKVKTVSTLEELKAAIVAGDDEIRLIKDIENIGETISIPYKVNFDGNNHKLSFSKLNKVGGVATGFVIMASSSKVNNLTVEMTAEDGWQGNYAMQVYNATGVVLNNVTAVNGDAGLLVNSSEVELTGTTTLNGNEFGGIEVSKSSNEEMRNSKLTVTGTIVMDNESTTAPLIWVEKDQGSVVTENKYVSKDMEEKGQIFYFADDSVLTD